MGVLSFLGSVIEPVTKLVDDLHTSDEEKLLIKAKMQAVENQMAQKVLGYETQLMQAQAKVITAEAQGASWLQRSWRPITMLTFLALVCFDAFGLLEFRLSEQAWSLLQIGLGGYVVGRSAEKIVTKTKWGNS